MVRVIVRVAWPARGLATPRTGSRPDVVSSVVSQKFRVAAPWHDRSARARGPIGYTVGPESPLLRKCASIFCLYIKVCSAFVSAILAGRRLWPPGWYRPWDHSPVGFSLWIVLKFLRSPGFGRGGSPSALGPWVCSAEPAACVGVQGRVCGRDRGESSWVRSLSLNGSGSVVGSLPFFSGLGAGRPWAGAGFRIQFRMPVAHSLEHARTGHIFILSIHKVIG